MKKSLQILAILVILLFVLLAFIDKTFLNRTGIKTVEKGVHIPTSKPALSPESENKKEMNAGYQWAEESQITTIQQCKGSKAFIQGCKSYIDDNVDETQQDQDSVDE